MWSRVWSSEGSIFDAPAEHPSLPLKKKAICGACGGTAELHRVVKRGPSHAIVEYDFDCCFCASSIATTEKTVTCAQCGNTLRIVRVGTHGVYRKAVPYLSDQDETLES